MTTYTPAQARGIAAALTHRAFTRERGALCSLADQVEALEAQLAAVGAGVGGVQALSHQKSIEAAPVALERSTAEIVCGMLGVNMPQAATVASHEPLIFDDFPEFHTEGMGCGLEDRNITDRYEAMRYGWDEALDAVSLNITGFLSEHPEIVRLQARVAELEAQAALVAQLSEPPEGWKYVLVNSEFNSLMDALQRAESKGYMPDAMFDEWTAFNWLPAAPTTTKD